MFWTYANCLARTAFGFNRCAGFPVYVIVQADNYTQANDRLTALVGVENTSIPGLARSTHFLLYREEWTRDATPVPTVECKSVVSGDHRSPDNYVVYYEDGTVIRGGTSQ